MFIKGDLIIKKCFKNCMGMDVHTWECRQQPPSFCHEGPSATTETAYTSSSNSSSPSALTTYSYLLCAAIFIYWLMLHLIFHGVSQNEPCFFIGFLNWSCGRDLSQLYLLAIQTITEKCGYGHNMIAKTTRIIIL